MNPFSSALQIARHTWIEVVLSRVFSIFGFTALALVAGSIFLTRFHFGSAEIRFINDLGQGTISLFGSILVITLGAQLFFREIEQRTLLPILARPVSRQQFLLGKFIGTLLPILVFTLGMLLLLSLLLWWRSGTLSEDHSLNVVTLREMLREAWLGGFFQMLKFFVMGSMVFAVASFAQSFTYTVSMGFCLFFASHLVHLAIDFYQRGETLFAQTIGFLFSYVLPDFRIYNELGADVDILRVCLYTLVYTVVYLSFAAVFFHKREL